MQLQHGSSARPLAARAPSTAPAGGPSRCPRPAAVALRARRRAAPLCAAAGSNGGAPAQQQQGSPAPQQQQQQQQASAVPSSLDIPYESASAAGATAAAQRSVRSIGGLRRAPLSGGVKTATARYDLPAPSVAVRNLVEQAQFAHLCTIMSQMHHRRAGYPFGTLVDFASDGAGMPIFCLSPLAIHARNLIEDPRCSLVVQMPGWTGLANARVTIFGDVFQLPPGMQDEARDIFLAKQANERKERWVLGNFMFFRMHRVTDIYFVGGFGTVQWIDVAEYLNATPDAIATNAPQRTLKDLNDVFARDLTRYLDPESPADEAVLISIDALGADVRVRTGGEFNVERIGFNGRVETVDQARAAMRAALAQPRK